MEIVALEKNMPSLEKYVDNLSEQVFLNDSYYGNILTVLTELFSLLCEEMDGSLLKYDYYTDFKNITINIQTPDNQRLTTYLRTKKLNDLEESVTSKRAFLVNTLADQIEISDEKGLLLTFDISAVHNLVAEERTTLLRAYFEGALKKAMSNRHD